MIKASSKKTGQEILNRGGLYTDSEIDDPILQFLARLEPNKTFFLW